MVKVSAMDTMSMESSSENGGLARPSITGGAKIGGSSGRKRKQSKPIRMHYASSEPVEPPQPMVIEPEPMASGLPDSADDEVARMQMDDVQSAQQCDLCNDTFANQGDLSEHVSSIHQFNNSPMEEEDSQQHASDIAFPTKYHMLGSQFIEQETAKAIVIEPQAPEPSENNDVHPPQYSTPPPPRHSNNDSRNSDRDNSSPKSNGSKSSRIFHQDAYCDLCDREFCNKYFLKTHMANKHGVYDGSPVPNGNSQVGTSSSSLNLNGSNNGGIPSMHGLPLGMVPGMPSSISEAQSHMASIPGMIVSAQRKSSPPPMKTVTPPAVTSQSVLSAPPQPVVLPPKPAEPKLTSTPTKPVAPDMEDYCEICQKHFCNKYYLKKHKQDVHGIIPDTPPQKRSRTTAPVPSSVSNNTPSSLSTPLNIPHPGLGNGAHAGLNGMPNLMFLNPFAPPLALQGLQSGLLPAGLLPPGFPLPPGMSTPGGHEPGLKTPPSSNASDSSNSERNSESLRGMNPLDAEAYCELCRKEFCNKYFLKIHRANKHGIFDEDLLGLPGAGGFMMPNFPLPEGEKNTLNKTPRQ